jgi:hypothetical protein
MVRQSTPAFIHERASNSVRSTHSLFHDYTLLSPPLERPPIYSNLLILLNLSCLLLPKHMSREQAFEPQPGRVHGRFRTSVDEDVVEERTKRAAAEWGNHRDLWLLFVSEGSAYLLCCREIGKGVDTHPEVIAACAPDFMTIAQDIRHEPWSKVSRKIDCVARLPSKSPMRQYH